MSDKVKKSLIWGLIGAFLVGLLYFMFKDSYKEILLTIKNTELRYIFLIILLGYFYQILDAVPCWLFIRKYLPRFSLINAVQTVYLGVFMSTATLGAGIAPTQAYFLHKQGLPAGKGISLMTMPYIFHKTVIMLYSFLVLLFFGRRIFGYIEVPLLPISVGTLVVMGYIVSTIIVVILLILCTSKTILNLLIKLIDKLKTPLKWQDKIIATKTQMLTLNKQSRVILQYRGLCLKVCAIDFLKMTVLYLIPYVCFMGVSGEVNKSILVMIMLSSVMRLLIDVAPNIGGIGPTEIAFTIIFMSSFGEVEAAAAMILYRLGTYYIPFITSAIVSVYVRKKGLI